MAAPPCSSYHAEGLFATAVSGLSFMPAGFFVCRVCGVSGMINQPGRWKGGGAVGETWAESFSAASTRKLSVFADPNNSRSHYPPF
jgi:hypothetical protein